LCLVGLLPMAAAQKPEASSPPNLSPIAPAPPPPKPTGRPSIGLALGGGGALALSEIGVLQWFEEHHIPVDMVAGASMGCMVGALYSTGKSVEQLKLVMNDSVFNSVFSFNEDYKSRSFRRRQDSRELPNAITIGLRRRISFRNALLTDQGLDDFLDRQFFRYGDRTDFNQLSIPLRCLSTDLNEARTVTFARGSLPDAVRASVSLPGVYQPFQLNGHEYVDGGVLENLPTPTLKEMKADVVLAVSLPLEPVSQGQLGSILGVLQRSFSVAIEGAERQLRQQPKVVMMPDVSGFSGADFLKTVPLAQRGYAAAEAHRAELLAYALPDAQWADYLADRRARLRGPAGPILRVEVKAPSDSATRAVQRLFAPLVNQPPDTRKIDALLDQIRSDGRYGADYTVGYETATEARPTLRVTVIDKPPGPPYLLLGVNIEGQTTAVTRATVEGRLLQQDLGGYGSELRSEFKLGYLTQLDSEYYRPVPALSSPTSQFFYAPHAGLLRQPFSIYANQVRLADRQLQRAGIGGDIGWSNASTQELRAGIEYDYTDWRLLVGNDNLPNYTGGSQSARLRYTFDTQDRALVPHFGVHFVSAAGYLYHAAGSPSAPQLVDQASVAYNFKAHGKPSKQILILSGEGASLLQRNVAQPFRYTLGGPLHLSASAIGEYRGTDYYLFEPALLRRLASLPQPLGQSIYLGAGYEFAQIFAPSASTITRQDVYFGVFAETPLGVITLAPAIGSDGHRKFVFTLGKLF
jgi:NTE family protein